MTRMHSPQIHADTDSDGATDTNSGSEHAYHFQVVRRALDILDAEGPDLSLTDLSDRLGMSPAHLQRVFTRWAGVSPKRYQQYLSLDHARRLLRDRFTTLATAQSVGLSGPGRLHDLFVTWEAMSPGAFARGGAGLTIRWSWCDSPFGPALIMATDRGICGLGFGAETGRPDTFADLQGRWPNATYVEDPAAVAPLARSAFGTDAAATARLHLIGAPFQIKVWEALLSIPPGQVTTYSEIARAIGAPKAARAVGTCVGRNPIGWLIPCHRALRKSGGLGGYHWGLPVKRAMLAWETAAAEAGQAS